MPTAAAKPHLLRKPGAYREPTPGLDRATCDFALDQVLAHLERRPDDVVYAVTLHPLSDRAHPDLELSLIPAEAQLRSWNAILDRDCLGYGERFARMKPHRPMGAFVAQRGAIGFHWHGVMAVPPGKAPMFELAAPLVWRQITRRQSGAEIKAGPNGGWLSYLTRHLQHPQAVIFRALPWKGH